MKLSKTLKLSFFVFLHVLILYILTIKIYDWFFQINKHESYATFFPSLLTLNGLLILNLILIAIFFSRRFSTILKVIYTGVILVFVIGIVLASYNTKGDVKTFSDFWDAYYELHTSYVWYWIAKINYIVTPILIIIHGILLISSGRFKVIGYKVFKLLQKHQLITKIVLGICTAYCCFKIILSSNEGDGFEFNFYTIRSIIIIFAVLGVAYFIYNKMHKKRLTEEIVTKVFDVILWIIKIGLINGMIYFFFLYYIFLEKYGIPKSYVETNIDNAERFYKLLEANQHPFNLFPSILLFTIPFYLLYFYYKSLQYKGGYLNPNDPWLPQNVIKPDPEAHFILQRMIGTDLNTKNNLEEAKALAEKVIDHLHKAKGDYEHYLRLWSNFEPLSDEEYAMRGNRFGDRRTEYNRADVSLIKQRYIQEIRRTEESIDNYYKVRKSIDEKINEKEMGLGESNYEKL